MTGPRVATCLWFADQAEEAATFYVSLVAGSRIDRVTRPSPESPALLVEFTLGEAPFQALNGGPKFTHSEAASISVLTADQQETDELWNALVDNGGSESRCGWLKDRYGVSWQIVPAPVARVLSSEDSAAADRAMRAVLDMAKIDIAAVEAACRTG